MRMMYLPLLVSREHGRDREGEFYTIFQPEEDMVAFYTEEAAKEHGRHLLAKHPRAKIVILQSSVCIEPRKIEFSEKKYSDNGELLV